MIDADFFKKYINNIVRYVCTEEVNLSFIDIRYMKKKPILIIIYIWYEHSKIYKDQLNSLLQ